MEDRIKNYPSTINRSEKVKRLQSPSRRRQSQKNLEVLQNKSQDPKISLVTNLRYAEEILICFGRR